MMNITTRTRIDTISGDTSPSFIDNVAREVHSCPRSSSRVFVAKCLTGHAPVLSHQQQRGFDAAIVDGDAPRIGKSIRSELPTDMLSLLHWLIVFGVRQLLMVHSDANADQLILCPSPLER